LFPLNAPEFALAVSVTKLLLAVALANPRPVMLLVITAANADASVVAVPVIAKSVAALGKPPLNLVAPPSHENAVLASEMETLLPAEPVVLAVTVMTAPELVGVAMAWAVLALAQEEPASAVTKLLAIVAGVALTANAPAVLLEHPAGPAPAAPPVSAVPPHATAVVEVGVKSVPVVPTEFPPLPATAVTVTTAPLAVAVDRSRLPRIVPLHAVIAAAIFVATPFRLSGLAAKVAV
jgi:hypothetical protein